MPFNLPAPTPRANSYCRELKVSFPVRRKAHNQLGSPGVAKRFVKGADFLSYVRHIFSGGSKKFPGGFRPPCLRARFGVYVFKLQRADKNIFIRASRFTQRYICVSIVEADLSVPWRTQKIFVEWGFIQWHMVTVCIWCALFVTSQFDVIFMFPNQRFGEVC